MKMSNVKCQMSNSWRNQAGVAQLALVLLLLAGVAVGTYVVQNRTNLLPHAQELGSSECSEDRRDNECRDDGYIYEIYQDCNGDYRRENTGEKCGGASKEQIANEEKSSDRCQYDEKYEEYECKNGYRCWNDYYKSDATSCKWESKDPHYHCDKDPKCNGSTEQQASEARKEEKSGTSAPGNNASSTNTQYDQGDCRDGAPVKDAAAKDGYAWIAYCSVSCTKNSDCAPNTSDGAVNPATSNWCFGFNNGQVPRCLKLVQTDNKEVADQNRKTANAKAVESIKSTLAQGGNPNPATEEAKQSSSADLRAKVEAQSKQRQDLVGEMATILNAGGSTNSTLTAEISRAQTLITSAASNATACYTGNDKPLNDSCDAVAQAANDTAVAASRVALFDSVAAGVPNTCVKVDMAVGNTNNNSLIEVAPVNNPSTPSRLFMCRGAESSIGARDGVILWQVRDDKGVWQSVSQDSLNKLGLKTGQKDASSIPQDLVNRRNNAATLSSQPAFTANNLSAGQTASTAWKEVPLSNCLNNCSSFPSSATCYQKGTANQYNCDGQKPASLNQSAAQPVVTEKKNLAKNAPCSKNSECRSGQCNPGTSKCN